MTDQCNFKNQLVLSHSSPFRVGFDLVQISRIIDSISCFGDGFKNRLFTQNELNYAHQGKDLCPQRLAARFAAKEATIKELRWPLGPDRLARACQFCGQLLPPFQGISQSRLGRRLCHHAGDFCRHQESQLAGQRNAGDGAARPEVLDPVRASGISRH